MSESTPLIIFLVLVVAVSGASADETSPVNSATLPLDDVLQLHRDLDSATRADAPEPPVPATLDKFEVEGRLLDAATEMVAKVQITVLSDSEWVEVPILVMGQGLSLTEIPALDRAALVMNDRKLVFVSKVAGRYNFDLGMIQRATGEGSRRRWTLETAPATLATLRLEYDRSTFRLLDNLAADTTEQVLLFPRDGRYTVGWQRLRKPKTTEAFEAPPPADPVIREAHLSVVSTLEGERFIRALYSLRLQDAEELVWHIPEGHKVESLYRNGQPFEVSVEASELRVEALPKRTGADAGTIELVLRSQPGSYELAGKLEFLVPRASWQIDLLYVDLHLPEVFNYSWTGGSLEPAETAPKAAFSHTVPTPGKRLSFRQSLVSEATPRITLDYTIDLEGRYYRPNPSQSP